MDSNTEVPQGTQDRGHHVPQEPDTPRPQRSIDELLSRIIEKALEQNPDLAKIREARQQELSPSMRANIARLEEEMTTNQVTFEALLGSLSVQADLLRSQREGGAAHGIEIVEETIKAIARQLQEALKNQSRSNRDALRIALSYAQESNLDKKTGLYTRLGLADIGARTLLEWFSACESGSEAQPRSLRRTAVVVTDMMLFHFGNQSLEPSGFDERIGLLTQGYIAMSRFLADGNGDLYPPFDNQTMDKDVGMQTYFPKDSEVRAKLASLQGKVKVSPGRLHPGGGDEFIFLIDLSADATDEDAQKAIDLINHVTRSTTLSPNMPILKPGEQRNLDKKELAQRAIYHRTLCDSLNELSVEPSGDISPQTAAKYNKFAKLLRKHLLDDSKFSAALARPDIDITMDYAWALLDNGGIPTLDDAVVCFFCGTDAYGNRFRDGNGLPLRGFLTEKGDPDEDKINNYAAKIAPEALSRMFEQDLQDSSKVREAILTTIMRDICRNFFDTLNDRVNKQGKLDKKISVLIAAYSGDASAAFTVAATIRSGRPFLERSNRNNFQVLSKLLAHYEELFAQNDQSVNPDLALQRFSTEWQKIKAEIPQTPESELDRRQTPREQPSQSNPADNNNN